MQSHPLFSGACFRTTGTRLHVSQALGQCVRSLDGANTLRDDLPFIN